MLSAMALSDDQEKLKSLLIEVITILCKKGLNYEEEFTIEGLLGITVDSEEMFLLNINEKMKNNTAPLLKQNEIKGMPLLQTKPHKCLLPVAVTDNQENVNALLNEAITILCKNGLDYENEFTIKGLLGITLDSKEIFLLSINKQIKSDNMGSSQHAFKGNYGSQVKPTVKTGIDEMTPTKHPFPAGRKRSSNSDIPQNQKAKRTVYTKQSLEDEVEGFARLIPKDSDLSLLPAENKSNTKV